MQRTEKLKYFLQIAISFTIAIILAFHLNLEEFRGHFSKISLPLAGTVLLLLIPSIGIRSYRWKSLFDDQSNNIRLSESATLLLVGMAFNLVLPASSGDIVKSYFGYKWSGVKERMLSISLLDKVIALASISVLGIPFAIYGGNLLYGGLSTLVLLPGITLLILPRLIKSIPLCEKIFQAATRIIKKKLDFLTVVEQVNISRAKLVGALAISVLGWSLTYLQMYLCLKAINANVSLLYMFSVAPLLTLIRLCPFTLSGLGSDEAALCYFFMQDHASLEKVLAGALIYRFLTLILPGLIGLFLLARTKHIGHNNDTK